MLLFGKGEILVKTDSAGCPATLAAVPDLSPEEVTRALEYKDHNLCILGHVFDYVEEQAKPSQHVLQKPFIRDDVFPL